MPMPSLFVQFNDLLALISATRMKLLRSTPAQDFPVFVKAALRLVICKLPVMHTMLLLESELMLFASASSNSQTVIT